MRLFVALACLACLACQRPSTTASQTRAETRSAEPAVLAPPPSASVVAPAPPVAALAPFAEKPVVHLPSGLAAGQKAPLLLLLHSLGTSAEDIQARTDWPRFAEQHGIAWLAPNGPVDAQGRRFWDAGPSCCNFTGPPIDHVAALRQLLEEMLAQQPIDRERVFIGGISNGGFMAHRLACAAPELVRGIVSISGAGSLQPLDCPAPTALRVLEIHGDSDPIVSFAGGHLFGSPSLPEHASVQKTMGDWAARLGCPVAPVAGEPINLEKRFPGYETRVNRYTGCARGKLELWTVTGGNHYLAFYDPAPEAVWKFLSE